MSEQFLSTTQVIELQGIVQRATNHIADLERQLAKAPREAVLRLLADDFWQALGHQQEWLERPQKVDNYVYKMRTQPGFIFDDAFWETFHSFALKICHVAYYGPERLEDGDRRQDTGTSELRFALADTSPAAAALLAQAKAVKQVLVVMAHRSCSRRGPGGHYNSVRCFDQGTPDHGSEEYGNEPLAKEKWCDGCAAFITLKEIYGRARAALAPGELVDPAFARQTHPAHTVVHDSEDGESCATCNGYRQVFTGDLERVVPCPDCAPGEEKE